MDKKILLQDNGQRQEIKEISMINDSQKLKMVLGSLSWKILTMLSKKEMYPLEIAKQLGAHEQKVYYHIRKLAKAGAIVVEREEKKKGATASRLLRPLPPNREVFEASRPNFHGAQAIGLTLRFH
jgi:DNA-binding MarR family transcriptional regulator